MAEGFGAEAVGASRPTVFISYASQDAALADTVVGVLERAGFNCWIAPRDVLPGAHYAGEIVRAINECSLVVLVLSARAIASPHVGKELERASSKRKSVIALRTDAAVLPHDFEYFLSESQWIEVGAEGIGPASARLVAAARQHLVDQPTALPGETTPAHPSSSDARKRPSRRVILGLAAVLVMLIAAAAAWKLLPGRSTTKPIPLTGAVAESRTSVAVMPFANLTGDPGKDYLADGMSEELLNVLAKVPGLKVPSRTSSFSYKGRNTDLKQIAADLHVDTILEGSVRSAGETIRITAQLIDARTDTHLWSETYDRKFTDVFKLQDDLANAILKALRVELGGGAATADVRTRLTSSVKAYDLYLLANSLWTTEKALHTALDLYGQAIELDPHFAAAFAKRATVRLVFLLDGFPLADARRDAERDARRALELDVNLASAHITLGLTHAFNADWVNAESELLAAISLAPEDSEPIGYHAQILWPRGRLHEAYLEAAKAYALSPANVNVIMVMGYASHLVGQDTDALRYADMAAALGMPANGLFLSRIYTGVAVRNGNYAEAATRGVGVIGPQLQGAGGVDAMSLVFAALADRTKRPAALKALRNIVQKLGVSQMDLSSNRELTWAFVNLDALDPAYELANQAVEDFIRYGNGGGPALSLYWDPTMRAFRQDPRFQGLVTRLNLIPYWKQYGPPDNCELMDDKLSCH